MEININYYIDIDDIVYDIVADTDEVSTPA